MGPRNKQLSEECAFYPLNLSCKGLDRQSLEYLHEELEKRAPLLFVTGSNEYDVEVLQERSAFCITAGQSETGKTPDEIGQVELSAKCLSTPSELEDMLEVLCLSIAISNLGLTCDRKTCRQVVAGFCGLPNYLW